MSEDRNCVIPVKISHELCLKVFLGVSLMWSNSGKETSIIIIIIMQHLQRHVSVVKMTNHRHDD